MPPARWLALAAVLALLGGCRTAAHSESPALADLVRDYDRDLAPFDPFTASEMGLHQYDRVLANDIGEEYRHGILALCTRYRDALRRLDPAGLAGGERVTYDVLAFRLDTCVEGFRFPWWLLPVNQAGGWPTYFPVVGAGRGLHPFRTAQNYADFLGRVDGFVTWMDTAIANMRAGVAAGVVQPRVVMERLLPQLDAQIVTDPERSLFYEPLRAFPAAVDAETQRRLTAQYVDAIQHKIVPAYRRLRDFIATEYLPRCRTTDGLGALPDGRAWYARAVRVATTTSLTPEEIYDIGVREVARIRAEMTALRAEIAAAREPPLPQYRTVDDLLRAYGALRGEVDAALPRLFGRFPRAGFEIRAIEPFRERSMSSSYVPPAPDGSRAGVFYLNAADVRHGGYATVSRNLYLHEAVPGHHFQGALQRENAALPVFRRFGWYVAFGEGWALYAEGLGDALGVYANRRDRLVMLGGELFRARRLVVDVGLHAKGWTRRQAIDYLGGPTPDNEREVERYMAWPAQALGYKIGQLEFLRLRRRAETALGAAFDVHAFHDELLRDGAMPLGALEAKMDRWLAAQKRG